MEIAHDVPTRLKQVLRKAGKLRTSDGWARLFLKMSMRMFARTYDEHWKRIVPNRALAPDKAIFETLQEDGIAIIPDWISPAEVRALQAEIESLPGFLEGAYHGNLNFMGLDSDGICALEITPSLPVSYRLTVANKELEAFATALYGSQCRLSSASVLNKFNPDRPDSSNVPHWDDWRVRFKAFIYVYDVNPENAPMVYLRGSRNAVPWRLEKDFVSQFLPNAAAGNAWWQIDPLGFEKLSCTGRAGTLVLFDALGIHSGTQLISGRRVMLMSMYTSAHPYKFRPY